MRVSDAKPRNPRHFETIEGGRERVSDTLLTKTTLLGALRGTQQLLHALFGVKVLSGTIFAPPLQKPGYGARWRIRNDRQFEAR